LRRALGHSPQHRKALANLGALLQYRGHLLEAIACHRQALELAPDDAEVRCNLAKALSEAGRSAEGLELCDAGLRSAPGHPLLLGARGAVLIDGGDFAEASLSLEGAVARRPDDDMAWVNLAYARAQLGRHDLAIESLQAARAANPDGGRATADLVNLLSGTGRGDEALGLATAYLARHPGERQVLAAQVFALHDAGREAQAGALLDPGRFIRVQEVAAPAGFPDLAAFNARLFELVEGDPSLTAGPPGKSTRGGFQTGELDLAREPALVALGAIIGEAVRAATAAFEAAGLAGHPLMACATRNAALRAWGTVLGSGGRQAPHIHPLGWLSGVYYVAVPADMGAAAPQAGWIEFGAPPERFLVSRPPAVRTVEPVAGRLVLFPSYCYHRTLPFVSGERRVSIAFDVVPTAVA
jgi:tetratricopeptide (TPR) repeat protein